MMKVGRIGVFEALVMIKVREILPLGATLFGIAYFATHWTVLPDVVPIHFGLMGQPDGWAPKAVALILPAVAIFLYVMLRIGESSNRFNLPWQITDSNREQMLELCRRLMFVMRTQTSILIAYLQYAMVETAMHRMDGLGVWFAPAFIGGITATLILFFLKGKRVAHAQ
jgi:uncharacterized membrane protein